MYAPRTVSVAVLCFFIPPPLKKNTKKQYKFLVFATNTENKENDSIHVQLH